MTMTLTVEMPRWDVGTPLTYRGRSAEVIGYHIEHDTDTGACNVTYRIAYEFSGQHMTVTVPRSTVDRSKMSG